MSLDTSIFDADLVAAIADLPASMTWKGAVYSVAASDITKGKRLEMEGFYVEADLMVVCRSADFSSQPEQQDTISIGGTTYRVERIMGAADAVSFTLYCTEVTR